MGFLAALGLTAPLATANPISNTSTDLTAAVEASQARLR